MIRAGLIVAFLSAVFVSGCATRRVATESAAATAADQWDLLRERASAAQGWRSLSRVQWISGGRTQSFDATFVADDRGRLVMEGLTPIGTTAATLWTDGTGLTFLNHRARTWWTGPLESIPDTAPLVPVLRNLGVSAAAGILFGYPSADGAAEECQSTIEGALCRRVAGIEYHVSRSGLVRAAAPGAVAEFEPASVPATAVRVTSTAGVLTITNRAVEPSDERVERPQADPSWTCCVLPTFE